MEELVTSLATMKTNWNQELKTKTTLFWCLFCPVPTLPKAMVTKPLVSVIACIENPCSFINKFKDHHTRAVLPGILQHNFLLLDLIHWDLLRNCWITICPSDLSRSSYFQSWSRSNQAAFKACTVSARLVEGPALLINLHQVCPGAAWDSELGDYLLYWTSHNGGPRRELLEDVTPLCCYY